MEATGKRYVLHPSRSDEFTLWHISDIHWMNAACTENRINRDLKKIEDDPYALWTGGGDYCEFINAKDPRFDASVLPAWVPGSALADLGAFSCKHIMDKFAPIKNKCLGLGMGNHELKYAKANTNIGMHERLCEAMGVPNLGYSGFFDLVFVRTSEVDIPTLSPTFKYEQRHKAYGFRIFTHHGAGAAQTKGGRINRLVRFMEDFEADIYLIGHVHGRTGERVQRIGANSTCTKLEDRDSIGVISGSYLKTYAQGIISYAEPMGWRPSVLGAARIKIIPDKRKFYTEI